MKRFLLLLSLVLHAAVAAAQGSLEVLPLRHRSAEQVIPVLRPLVEAGGVLSGQGYRLFVRTSAQAFHLRLMIVRGPSFIMTNRT